MPDNYSQIRKTCEIIFATLNLDIIISDRNQNILLQLLHTPLPEELMLQWNTYHTEMIHLTESANNGLSWHTMYDGLMLFLDLQLKTEEDVYYVTIGPALLKLISDVTFADIIRQNKLSSRTMYTIRNYIKKAPFYTLKTKNAFWISSQLLYDNILPISSEYTVFEQDTRMETIWESKEQPITNEQILLNYQSEKKWLAYVAAGDAPSAKKAFLQMSSNDYLIQQSRDPARMIKNLLHTINGMCKAAACSAGAAPLDIFAAEQKSSESIESAENAFMIETIIFEILDDYCKTVVSARTAGYSLPVKKAIEYISNHYSESISRKRIAQEIHYSEGHLTRIFQRETGQKISEYLYHLRIENACRLLETGGYTITDIALLTGFSSYGKFSVEFKKRMGSSASQYQKYKLDTL